VSYGYTYTLPALHGIQAGRDYYVAMCPLKLLPKIFLFDEVSLPPELRAQRTLNTARVPEIVRYIVENLHDYAFSAITASIDGEVRFEPANMGDGTSDIGRLIIPMSARFIINDGQHRRAAIEAALKAHPELEDETIAVVFFVDTGLHRTQQLFADLNKHAVRPTQSLGVLYDYRDPLACLSRELAQHVFYFKGLTELEKTTLSNRSIELFTLSGIYQATSALLGKRKNLSIRKEEQDLAFQFWTELGKVIPEWQLAAERKISSAQLRHDYVHAHNIALHAFGLAGYTLVHQRPHEWISSLPCLRQIDWARSNRALWEGRAMIGGQMSKARQNVQLTANLIKVTLGLTLTPEETKLEEKYQAGMKGFALNRI
jgi:DNA sulfur modification protein DndB